MHFISSLITKKAHIGAFKLVLVRLMGFEPTYDEVLPPEDSASTNFATAAYVIIYYLSFQENNELPNLA